jgi:hypothetical protein
MKASFLQRGFANETLEIVTKVRHSDPNPPTTATDRYDKRAVAVVGIWKTNRTLTVLTLPITFPIASAS